jgi:HPt (histidine-containing phosphotransfer) domain-containing protein
MTQTAMDTSILAEVKEIMGDDFNEVVKLVIDSLPEQLNILESAIENNNAELLNKVSHKMKGSSGSIGALGLADKLHTIELIGREGSTDITEQALGELRETINQVLTIINAELSN